ncbi:hypothetical protein [Clostridium sp. UBA2485]|uniref:hypothetical protein n=1 Tax=Clostridium sp. UBA2485 TaxID=1946352 RepID=UPI0025C387ED|nr:hypothetical protein [Clostridium sp. UBA2485]
MKTYKTWEVIKVLTENPNRVFIDETKRTLKITYGDITLYSCDGRNIGTHWLKTDCKWRMKETEVSFLEAIKAYNKGKDIYCETKLHRIKYRAGDLGEGGKVLDEYGRAVSIREILEGKWYIEED